MAMKTERLYLRHADVLATVDAEQSEIRDGALLTEGKCILQVGTTTALDAWLVQNPSKAPTRTIDARGCVVTPGLVNCHHHMYQTLPCMGGPDARGGAGQQPDCTCGIAAFRSHHRRRPPVPVPERLSSG
jgi:cytosine/adenosine deaminase-related metal-dependent hydrolase